MLSKLHKESEIETIDDLRYKKKQLVKKAKKKEKKIKKKLAKLKIAATTPVLYDELLSEFDLQHSLLNMLPMLLKYREQIGDLGFLKGIKNSPKKRFAVITLGAVGAALYTYFSLSVREEKKQNRRKTKGTKNKKTTNTGNIQNIEDLFV